MAQLDLLAFQREDVEKLKTKRSRLIGNDPGTGKTYEGIALDLANRSGDGNAKVNLKDRFSTGKLKTLIVCPKNALDVWDYHLGELTDLPVYRYSYATRHTFMRQAQDPKLYGYFIVNYDSVRINDLEGLQQVNWFHIIGDEIHRIKNRKAQLTLAFKKLRACYKTGMSGTPADNKPTDLWSVLHWLWPSYFTSYWRFVKAYTIQEMSDDGYSKTTGVKNLGHLHGLMKPWYVRRLKRDVLTDLPDKYYMRIMVELGPKQRKAYDQMKKTMTAWVESHQDEIEREDPIIAQAVVAQLVRLQQMTAGYIVPQLDEDGEQVQKFVHKKHRPSEGTPCTELCAWLPQWEMTDPSAKLDALMELLDDRGDEPIIVFSQSKAVINLLGRRLAKKGITFGLYTGDTKQADRDQLVQDFQAGRIRVFAGTIKAGGEAITLTRASTVVFIDRWWSPSKNIQAEDRAHRIGQKNAVEIIDIMAKKTVDLGRHQAILKKWEWLKMLLGDEDYSEELLQRAKPELLMKEMLEDVEE